MGLQEMGIKKGIQLKSIERNGQRTVFTGQSPRAENGEKEQIFCDPALFTRKQKCENGLLSSGPINTFLVT
jgi:hypothetical protein